MNKQKKKQMKKEQMDGRSNESRLFSFYSLELKTKAKILKKKNKKKKKQENKYN